MTSPQPFQIEIPQSQIAKLKQKLSLVDFPNELSNSAWDLGCPLSEIKRLTAAWEKWDWKVAERSLNQYPQFHTDISVDNFETLDIHFIHQRSSTKDAIPLLFVHGWPGSFLEVLKILQLLSKSSDDPSGPKFHVIAPSLPNYGFSQGVSKRGFGLAQYAETCHKLMLKLGYRRYVTQAGDWGFWITRAMGRLYPESCRVSHFNMVCVNAPSAEKGKEYHGEDKAGLERTQWFEEEGRGYNYEQSTKPQTLAYALHDSPVALLAWIYEKLHDWTDSYPWSDDEILTWVSVYYFSRAGPGAAHRIYYEVQHTSSRPGSDGKVACTYDAMREYEPHVPIGLTYNPRDIYVVPSSWGRTLGNVVYEARNDRGGHFYAHECPEMLVRDLKKMFEKDGVAYQAVANSNSP